MHCSRRNKSASAQAAPRPSSLPSPTGEGVYRVRGSALHRPLARRETDGVRVLPKPETYQDFAPPILHTAFHCAAVTGCTERREFFTRTMSASPGVALISAMVTGCLNGETGFTSTCTNLPVLSLGSG